MLLNLNLYYTNDLHQVAQGFEEFNNVLHAWAIDIIADDPPYGYGLRNVSHVPLAKALIAKSNGQAGQIDFPFTDILNESVCVYLIFSHWMADLMLMRL